MAHPTASLILALLGCWILLRADAIAVISIDLGNEFMKVGIVKPGIPMEIVLNGDSQRKTATMVAMRNGEREFGNAAQNTAVKYPQDVYMFLRDLLAKPLSHSIVQEFQRRFPYYKLHDGPEHGSVLFESSSGQKYSVEELLAMVMESAKEFAERFAEQPITDAVIVIPSYFNQAERRAVARATSLAGLKLLQLMNDNAAVALNYGVFRRKEFNATAQHYMFYDMGATGTVASIMSYQVVKTKHGTTVETNPQVSIRGIGFDRTLGSLEVTLRLRDYLANLFNDQKKTTNDVMKNSRAMAKLLKEADRVKKILSANTDTFAQVEGLLDDKDFKAKLTRDDFENLCADIFARSGKPVEDALKAAGMTMEEINEVILMGGGTRVPKVQEVLRKAIGRDELGKSINTDEAAALGAVYQAAALSKGFKVKTFTVRDANIYPIQVEFDRLKVSEEGTEESKTVKRVLFSHMNSYPQKKVMTFNKQSKDFDFYVRYGDLAFMDENNQRIFSSKDIAHVALSGMADALEKHTDNQTESKGVKAHFELNPSGILALDSVELVFEKPENSEEESTISKITNTISSFFSGNQNATDDVESKEQKSSEEAEESASKTGPATEDAPTPEEEEEKDEEKQDTADKSQEEDLQATADHGEQSQTADAASGSDTADIKSDANASATSEKTTSAPASKDSSKSGEIKKVLVKEVLIASTTAMDHVDPSADVLKISKSMLAELHAKDKQRQRLEKAKNDIEAFIIEARVRLDDDDYKKCSTEDQRASIEEQMAAAADWLEQQDADTAIKAYDDKLVDLKAVTRDLYGRVFELRERPKALAALKDMLNHTQFMLKSMRNFTGDNGPFTEVEMEAFAKLINETTAWKAAQEKLQKKRPLHEAPAFTIDDVATHMRALDREMKYLLNKAKTYVPKKPKPTGENATSPSNATSDEEAPEGEGSESVSAAADREPAKDADEAAPTGSRPPKKAAVQPETDEQGEPEVLTLDGSPSAQLPTGSETVSEKEVDAVKHGEL